MDQPQIEAKTPRLDTIPEDTAIDIARVIQSWARVDGSKENREKARRSRDSALRALALSCRNSFRLFHPILLTNITLRMKEVPAFYHLLEQHPEYGRLIRTCILPEEQLTDEQAQVVSAQFCRISSLPSSADEFIVSQIGLRLAKTIIYSLMSSLEVLVLRNWLMFPPFRRLNGRMEPISPFKSLKKLHIGRAIDGPLNGRNVAWLLVFPPNLEEASLGLVLSTLCLNYLSEHANVLEGASSVKRLSLQFAFVFEQNVRSTWWGSPQDARRKKTETLLLLLSLVKDLTALEVYHHATIHPHPTGDPESEDWAQVSFNCLGSLERCYQSLKHLRIYEMPVDESMLSSAPLFERFEQLRILSFSRPVLSGLVKCKTNKFPPSIEILALSCHNFFSHQPFLPAAIEEDELGKLLLKSSREWPNLKQVVVPSSPRDGNGDPPQEVYLSNEYRKRRSILEKAAIFRSGKVELRKVELGEEIGDPVQGEVFISMLMGVSPF